jgi:hypothetical protein
VSTCGFNVIVNLSTNATFVAPTIVGLVNLTTNNEPGLCGRMLSLPITVTGFPPPVVSWKANDQTITLPYTFHGITSLTAEASNAVGIASSTATIGVLDEEAPVFSGVKKITAIAPPGSLSVSVHVSITATDNCDGPVKATFIPDLDAPFGMGLTRVQGYASDKAGNIAHTSFDVIVEPAISKGRLFTFNPQFFGSMRSRFNGISGFEILCRALDRCGPLVIGEPGRSLLIRRSDARLLWSRLPAVGPSEILPLGDQTLSTANLPTLQSKGGRFNNRLLGLVIGLELTLALHPELRDYPLQEEYCTQGVSPGADGVVGTPDDVPLPHEFKVFLVAATVLKALKDPSLGIVQANPYGLSQLAKRGLGGKPTGSVPLEDLAVAIARFLCSFDCGRLPADCSRQPLSLDSINDNWGKRVYIGVTSTYFTLQDEAPRTPSLVSPPNARVYASNRNATKEPGEPDIAGNPGGHSVWWQWQAPSTGPVTVTTDGSSFDTLLGVFTGTSLSNLVLVASNDDAPGRLTSEVTFQAQAGTDYQIVVDGADGDSGEIVLTVTGDPPVLCVPDSLTSSAAQLCIDGELGRTYTIEASPDLFNWTLIATAVNTDGSLRFADPARSNFPKRFYRVNLQP